MSNVTHTFTIQACADGNLIAVAKVLVQILFLSFTWRFDSAEEVAETKITTYGTTTRFIYDLGTSTEETQCVSTF